MQLICNSWRHFISPWMQTAGHSSIAHLHIFLWWEPPAGSHQRCFCERGLIHWSHRSLYQPPTPLKSSQHFGSQQYNLHLARYIAWWPPCQNSSWP